jgi:hypothetical protein
MYSVVLRPAGTVRFEGDVEQQKGYGVMLPVSGVTP